MDSFINLQPIINTIEDMNRMIFMAIAMLLLPCALMAAQPQMVIMGGQYDDTSLENKPNHRAPARPIMVNQDGHKITFEVCFVGEFVQINRGETTLYSTIIGENGCVDIPTEILGEVELCLYRGNMVYHAIVEL